MKKTYIIPQTTSCQIQPRMALMALSSTDVEGLGISNDEYTGESRVKREDSNVWNDDWSY